MGSLACATVSETQGLDLVARIGRGDDLALAEGADTVIDLSVGERGVEHATWAIEHAKHVVVATSGLGAGDIATIRARWAETASSVGVLIVPNFSLGALLARRFASMAAPHFEEVEIVEGAPPQKADAPSGTAIELAEALAAQDGGAPGARLEADTFEEAARGARFGSVAVHSVRIRGMVNHQEVLLGRDGEVLSIRFDTLDRAAYMPGVVASLRKVSSMPGVHVGLEAVYGEILR
ncbi:4-hydroxy-tetrahydrodipicolinate reductase [Xylanimonas allomyrinae]|uniref:4-hydroxy-tetrahydrodipicolinate reductase n=2 Tax=Xylanimonas allomyrinae TaxID=2509459 RepID=A0A4P6EQB8_9MICO|nr:4-hydroxy-tetrahydrodipicolinate reductase [Xylanimonas allomyrinae]